MDSFIRTVSRIFVSIAEPTYEIASEASDHPQGHTANNDTPAIASEGGDDRRQNDARQSTPRRSKDKRPTLNKPERFVADLQRAAELWYIIDRTEHEINSLMLRIRENYWELHNRLVRVSTNTRAGKAELTPKSWRGQNARWTPCWSTIPN